MSKKLLVDLDVLSKELDRSRKEIKEYESFDEEMALLYKCRVDALVWVLKIGEEIE